MRITVMVFSIISIVLGLLGIIGTFSVSATQDDGSAILGGLLFLGQGVVSLIYSIQTRHWAPTQKPPTIIGEPK